MQLRILFRDPSGSCRRHYRMPRNVNISVILLLPYSTGERADILVARVWEKVKERESRRRGIDSDAKSSADLVSRGEES